MLVASTVVRTARWSGAPPVEAVDDRSLVVAAQADPRAFGVLYHRHVAAVYRYAARTCGDRLVAEDVTAATFERALAALPRFEWRGGGFRAWLFRIASAEVATWYRERERTTGERGRQAWQRGERVRVEGDDEADADDHLSLLRAMATLPDRYREVVTLRYLADMSAGEAAEALGMSKRMLAVTLHRALGALRTAMARRDQEGTRS
jgi:RNA polymerase sigma-70 factor (ECF subfamily)